MRLDTAARVLITPSGTLEAGCLVTVLQTARGIGIEDEFSEHTAAVVIPIPRGVPGPSEELVARVRVRTLPVLLVVDLVEPWTIAVMHSLHGCGVVPWRSPARTIIAAVRASLAGQPINRRVESDDDPVMRLSAREREVMAMVALGEHNDEIARRLEISTHTVESHVQHVFIKLGVTHRHAAATIVRQSALMTTQLRNFRTLASLTCQEPA